jgi:hypothetical protein
VRSRDLFHLEDYDRVIPEWMVFQAWERYVKWEKPVIPLQNKPIAIGANTTVFTVRQGSHILEKLTYNKQEIDITAKRLMELIDKYKNYVLSVYCNGDGLGTGIVDICSRNGYCVNNIHSSERATLNNRYANKRAEMWYAMRDWLYTQGCLDRADTLLHEQLQNVFFYLDKTNHIWVESMENLVDRSVPSLDHADSLVYTFTGECEGMGRIRFV